jgi:hypothetical protein
MDNHVGIKVAVEQKHVSDQNETASGTTGLLFTFLTMVFMVVFTGAGVLIGFFIWGNKTNQSNMQSVSAATTATQSNVASGNWTQYWDVNFSIKYPVDWLLKRGYASANDLMIYDPKSVKQMMRNGAQSQVPTIYLDVLYVTPSTQSAAETIADFANTQKQKNIDIHSEESPLYKSDMVLFEDPGGIGKTILWSHNNLKALFNTSTEHLTDPSIENQILQTFQFIQQQ